MKSLPKILPNDIDALKALLLERENNWAKKYQSLLEQWNLAQHKKYAPSSEVSPDQVPLFNEAEQLADEADDDTLESSPKPAPKTPTKKTRRPRLPADLPREVQILDIENKRCACCDGDLHQVGYDSREKLEFIPASIKVIEQRRLKYSCRQCDRDGTKASFAIAPLPADPIPKSMATVSLLNQIIIAKFLYALPLYRQELFFKHLGIEISRHTMSRWLLRCAEILAPVNEALKRHLREQAVIWADETTLNVLDVKERQKCYMWVYGSGGDKPKPGGPPNIVLYDYQDGRSRDCIREFLPDFSGFMQVDGYAAYDQLPSTSAGCWAHARRKFVEAQKAQPKGKTGKADWAISQIAKLYRIESGLKGASFEARYQARQSHAPQLLDKLKAWLDKSAVHTPPKSLLGKALIYSLNQWPKLTRYIDDGRLNIDNNRAERAIRPFVIGRKNWLFSKTRQGAKASASLYSILESAKANDLDPSDYLTYLLTALPKLKPGDDVEHLMPWNATIQTPAD